MSRLFAIIFRERHDRKAVRSYFLYIFPEFRGNKSIPFGFSFFPIFFGVPYPLFFPAGGLTLIFTWPLIIVLVRWERRIRPQWASRIPALSLLKYIACSFGITKVVLIAIGIEFLLSRNDFLLTVRLIITGVLISLICAIGSVRLVSYLIYNVKRINEKIDKKKFHDRMELLARYSLVFTFGVSNFLINLVIPFVGTGIEENILIICFLVLYQIKSFFAYKYVYLVYLVWRYDCTDLKI